MAITVNPSVAETELVFHQAVEGLFQVGLRGRVTDALRDKLRAAGLDLARPLDPAYPRSSWNRFIRVTAETLWAGEPADRAYFALGRQLLAGYSETLLGKALAGVIRLIGPRRTLDRMTHNFRSGSNYNLSRVTEVAEREVHFWINEPELHPSYVAGILHAALELAGARDIEVSVHERDAQGCTYRIVWRAR